MCKIKNSLQSYQILLDYSVNLCAKFKIPCKTPEFYWSIHLIDLKDLKFLAKLPNFYWSVQLFDV